MVVLSMAVACQPSMESEQDKSVVVIPGGPVALYDTQLGMYYGDLYKDGAGVFSIVLSDARCHQDELGKPYMDSEGDMLVLNFRTPLLAEDADIVMPVGEFPVSAEGGVDVIDATTSYVTRLVGNTQSKWEIKSGSVSVSADEEGEYQVTTKDMIISKGAVTDTVEYVFSSPLKVSDYMLMAPAMLSPEDDIIDMPFPDVECVYNGDLFGYGTGNFITTLYTKGFKDYILEEDGEEVPGICLILNFFSRLYSGNQDPVLEEGTYNVSTSASGSLFERWSLLPGLLLDSTPFGSYLFQYDAEGELVQEYISSGVVTVEYDEEAETSTPHAKMCKMTYKLKTSSRAISGEWAGEVLVDNQADVGANESFLTTLDHDVECDMSKVTSGHLVHIETLHRENVEAEWDYDIAEAWQLYLQPRDWSAAEKDIPWNNADGSPYDQDGNGIRDRLDAWCQDGDVMVLEFILPLGSNGVIAPELNKTYTYTLQPSLAESHEMYEIYVSRMGRPVDEIFDSYYAEQFPFFAEPLGITSYDRTNARRGFTWAADGFRGNWYMHYETGRHGILDEHAPAVNGWVKVTRTAAETYDFEWDFIDDNPGTPNKITGSIEGCTVKIQQ